MRLAGFAIVVATLAACEQELRPPTTPTPTVPIAALHVSGPESVVPGATAQLTAIADYADGTSADVTSQSSFQTTESSQHVGVSFLPNGAARVPAASPGGFVKIRATFNGANSLPWTLFVLPPGTFRLYGLISLEGRMDDLNTPVEIVGGAGVGVGERAQHTFELGRYTYYNFYGVAGDLEVRASVAGYEPQVHRVNVTSTMRRDIDLQPLVAPAGISGVWTMAVTPSSTCASNLPAAATGRMFDVQMVQQGGYVEAFFSGPTIVNKNARHVGKILGEALSLWIESREFDSFNEALLFDRLSPTQWLGFSGFVKGTVAESEFTAVLLGNVDLYTSPAAANFPSIPPVAGCGGEHGVRFKRK